MVGIQVKTPFWTSLASLVMACLQPCSVCCCGMFGCAWVFTHVPAHYVGKLQPENQSVLLSTIVSKIEWSGEGNKAGVLISCSGGYYSELSR